jgi:hypothetical protein
MSGQIQVSSLRSLEELENAIGKFSSRFSGGLEDAERGIARKREQLEQIVHDRKRTVVYWRQEYDAADPEEDDVAAISRRLEQAEDDLQAAKRWQRAIEDSYMAYSRRAKEAMFLCTEHASKALLILKEKTSELRNYAALKPDLADEAATGLANMGTGVESTPTTPQGGEFERPGGDGNQIHEQNFREFMKHFYLRNLEFKDLGQQYVDVKNVMALNRGGDDWSEDQPKFWGHHGNSPESYDSMAKEYPILKKRLAGGETLDQLKSDQAVRPAAEFWWSRSDPINVTKFRDSYFVDQGFHRVTLAKNNNLGEVPCHVTEARLKAS